MNRPSILTVRLDSQPRLLEGSMLQRRRVIQALGVVGLVALGTGGVGRAEPSTPPDESVAVVAAETNESDLGSKQPQVAVDAAGRIYVAFGKENRLRCAVSDDGGKSFRVATVGAVDALSLGMRRGPRIAATDRTVVVTAIGGKIGKGRDGDLLAWRSDDGGASWTGPTRINRVEGSAREGLHATAASADGVVFCAWLDLRNQRTEIFGARSTDGGVSWEPDALVYHAPEKSVCECCHPSVAFAPDGSLYVMWRNHVAGARDLYFARSDDGRRFDAGAKLGRGTWPLNACPMDGGAIAAGRDGQVDSIWMRAGSIFAARPGENERALGKGVQGWTAFGPDGAYMAWLEQRPGRVLALLPGGTPIPLAERSNDPVVAAAPDGRGPVVAAWEENTAGGEIRLRVLAERERKAPRQP